MFSWKKQTPDESIGPGSAVHFPILLLEAFAPFGPEFLNLEAPNPTAARVGRKVKAPVLPGLPLLKPER